MFNNTSTHTKGWLYGILSQILWGTGGVAIKLIDTVIPSSLLVVLRHGIGAITLAILVTRSKTPIMKNLPIMHLIILGIFAAGLPDLLLIEAIRKSGAIVAAILARVEIPLGVIFAHLFLKENVGKKSLFSWNNFNNRRVSCFLSARLANYIY